MLTGPEPLAALADQIGRGAEPGGRWPTGRRAAVHCGGSDPRGPRPARRPAASGPRTGSCGGARGAGADRAARRGGTGAGWSPAASPRSPAAADGLQLTLAANRLETEDGRLTGRIVGEWSARWPRPGTGADESYGVAGAGVAVGCGPEAAELLRLAGLGVVVDVARPTEGDLERSAHLDALQFLLGLRADDPEEPLRPEDALTTARRAR